MSPKEQALSTNGQLRSAFEQIRVFYEMAAWLSTSLEYERVLDMVLNVSVHGFERLGVDGRVSGAVLLFSDDGDGATLRVAAHRRLTASEARATVPGRRGVIAEALQCAELTISTNPDDDPELKYFVTFREAQRVLCVPMRAEFQNYGVLVLGFHEASQFKESHILFLQAVANLAVISLQNAVLYQDLLEEKERIIEVDDEARKQLARDLHDGPTQAVSAIAMRVGFISRILETQPEKVADELGEVEQIARQTVSEIRHMLFTLRPLVLEAQGLEAALDQLAANMLSTHNQHVEIQAEPDCESHLDTHTQGVVFQIVEEAVNNARKHAGADVIAVQMRVQDDVIVVEVCDDGVGFDLEDVETGYESRGSLGMVNLRERAELVEGTLHIKTAPGEGTHITLLVPLAGSNGKLPHADSRTGTG